MRIHDISSVLNMEFNAVYLNTLKQFWTDKKDFQCIGSPKRQDIFLYFNGCKAIYTDKNQNKYYAKSGDVVYAPKGSEYKVVFYDFESPKSCTELLNFLLFDNLGNEFILSDKIEVIHPAPRNVAQIIRRIFNEEVTLTPLRKRAYIYEIIDLIGTSTSKVDDLIAPGFSYLSEHFCEQTPVSEIAKLCNVSEGYFRKRFRECLGISPIEYRNRLRIEKAREYLIYGDISIQEISDIIGYDAVSHFIKEFKSTYGLSPLKYRKSYISGTLAPQDRQ